MKTVLKNIAIVMYIMLCASCMRQLSESVSAENDKGIKSLPHFAQTKSGYYDVGDSIKRISFRQQDPDMRMLNQILCIDGTYRLAITADEAATLGIPADCYAKYEQYVLSLNGE